MKEAGWVPSAGVDESKPSGNTSGAGEPGQAEGEITKADLPDWLKAMAPEGALEEDASPPEVAGSAKETPLPPETGDAGLPDWLNEISPSAATEEPTIQPEPAAPVPSEAEIPAWLQEIPAAQAETPGPAAPAPQEPAEGAEEIPDWLQEIGEEKGPAEAAIAPVEEKTTIWEEEKPVEIPVSAPLEESVPGVKPGDQDAALAWLESLAAKQGASEEELTTRPEERQDTPPTWVQEVETPAAGEVEPGSEPTLIQGVTETPEPVEPSLVETEAEAPIEAMDSGLPDWLKEISGEPNVPGTIEQTPEAEEAPEPLELPEWLTTMGAESPAAAEAQTETTGPEPEELAQTPIEEILPIEPAETGPETITVWDEQGATQIQVSAPLEENIPGVNLEDQDAAMAWLESLAARQGAAEEELTSRPEERLETPPAWVEELSGAEKPGEQPVEVEAQAEEPQEAAVELEATTAAVSEEAFEEIATPEAKEAPVPPAGGVELPDWLQEMAMEDVGAQPIQPTLPAEGPVESALPDWLQEISLEEEKPAPMEAQAQAEVESQAELASGQPAEMEIQPPAALSEEEAAMAWLETLAARQGVPEEELTTPPEERPETPPSWVQEQVASLQPPMEEQAVVGEQETIIETPAAAEIEAPAPVEEVEQPTVFEAPTAEQPAVEAMPVPEEAQPQVAEETPLPEWLQEMAADEETPAAVEELFVEPAAAAEAPAPEQEPEAEPPLPAWLETVSEEEAVVEPGMPAGPLVDINTASLVELENLPGIGFILAQAIVNHREKHGPFNRIDDLADVAGFNPGIVAEIADRVTALPPAGQTTQVLPEIKELEGVSEYEAELVKARNAMVTGDIGNTLLHYGYLIKKNQLLAEVIRDLHEALYRYPVDANIWTVLGDAYMHNNQLQEALDTYIKAEELIR
jgi:competence ComEA-like helix-hairpin-helix protein